MYSIVAPVSSNGWYMQMGFSRMIFAKFTRTILACMGSYGVCLLTSWYQLVGVMCGYLCIRMFVYMLLEVKVKACIDR